MEDKEIYKKVEEEISRMVLETYEGFPIEQHLREKIMNFVTKAIRKTIDYKNGDRE